MAINMGKKKNRVWFYLKGEDKHAWSRSFIGKADVQYAAARDLWWRCYDWESVFFMHQALENLLKAIYLQNTKERIGLNKHGEQYRFSKLSKSHVLNRHDLDKLVDEIGKIIIGFKSSIKVLSKILGKKRRRAFYPRDFKKYQQGARYPDHKRIEIPRNYPCLLTVLDEMYYKIRTHYKFGNEEERESNPLETFLISFVDPVDGSVACHFAIAQPATLFMGNKFFKPHSLFSKK